MVTPTATMSPAFNSQLYGNIQAASQNQGQANAQVLKDNAARTPALGGAMQALLRQSQQQTADQAQQGTQRAQVAGMQAGQQLGNQQADIGYQTQQQELQRMLQQQQMDMQRQLQGNDQAYTAQQANIDRMNNMIGSVVGLAESA